MDKTQQQKESFATAMQPVIETIAATGVVPGLEEQLNASYPPSGSVFRQVEHACHEAIVAGWMCTQGGDGRRFGRVVEPSGDTRNLSIDVVDLTDIVGPHHRHQY